MAHSLTWCEWGGHTPFISAVDAPTKGKEQSNLLFYESAAASALASYIDGSKAWVFPLYEGSVLKSCSGTDALALLKGVWQMQVRSMQQ